MSRVPSAIGARSRRALPRGSRTAPGLQGFGDLEETEYIARIRSGTFEREDGAFVHLATTEARFMPD